MPLTRPCSERHYRWRTAPGRAAERAAAPLLPLRGGGEGDCPGTSRIGLLRPALPDRAGWTAIVLSTLCFNVHGVAWYGGLFEAPWVKLMKEHRGIDENSSSEESFETCWPYPVEASASMHMCGAVKSYFYEYVTSPCVRV